MSRLFWGLFASLCLAAGCSTGSEPGGGGGVGGEGGRDGSGGSLPRESFEDGHCRSTAAFAGRGCPESYQEALSLDRCGTDRCAGRCGAWLAVQDFCTPSLGCSYDPETGALVGVIEGSDTPDFCDGESRERLFGDAHHDCTFTDLEAGGCPLARIGEHP